MYRMSAAALPEPDQALLKKLRLRIDTDDSLYPGWKKLKMRGKDLNDLPPEVFWISELEVLDLSPEREACINYRIGRLPPGIGNLTGLRVLMLDTNEMDVLPSEICLLTMLEKLSISNNFIRTLPDGFSQLRRLESLYMANNRIDQFPMVICELLELRFLDLSDNLISDLPPTIARLQGLESLLLVYNRITRLPDSICGMINLHLLWIGYNRIRHLPIEFHRLANLDWGLNGFTTSLAIDGNPLVDPPVEVCKQGVSAIGDYMAEYGSRIVFTPAPPIALSAPDRLRSAVVVRTVPTPSQPPPPVLTTALEARSRTPLVELRSRYNDPRSLPPPDGIPLLYPVDPYQDLTYYGSNLR